jgi:hypothetical protein
LSINSISCARMISTNSCLVNELRTLRQSMVSFHVISDIIDHPTQRRGIPSHSLHRFFPIVLHQGRYRTLNPKCKSDIGHNDLDPPYSFNHPPLRFNPSEFAILAVILMPP